MMMKNLCLAKRNGKSVINEAMPVKQSKRYAILDILRGLALLGIALANFPEFSLYSFLTHEAREAMPTAGIDRFVYYLEYTFIDGKFYTLFSLLFGIGFSIILRNAEQKGADGMRIFYRRMVILLFIGFLHLIFIWSGDILMLYAVLGMLLPLFRNLSDRKLLTCAVLLLVLPIAADTIVEFTGSNPAAPMVHMQQYYCNKFGITDSNFAYWLRDIKGYKDMFQFLIQGAFERMQEFIIGNRYFKVLGLFLVGFLFGRKRIYADLPSKRIWLKRIVFGGSILSLPLSLFYAYSAMNDKPWGTALHSVLYLISVYPLAFTYLAVICLCFLHQPENRIFKWFAASGQMALTNYIGQSVCGVLLFYGIGLGLGTELGLVHVVWIALCIYLLQMCFSRLWLRVFLFGPLEWIWRMLTYGKIFKILKK